MSEAPPALGDSGLAGCATAGAAFEALLELLVRLQPYYRVHNEHVKVLSKIVLDLRQDGCMYP